MKKIMSSFLGYILVNGEELSIKRISSFTWNHAILSEGFRGEKALHSMFGKHPGVVTPCFLARCFFAFVNLQNSLARGGD